METTKSKTTPKKDLTIVTPLEVVAEPIVEVAKQTVKFVFYQLDKEGNKTFSMPNEFEVAKDADIRSIAYWLLRPIAVQLKRKTELDLEYSKIKGNNKKAKLPFSTSKACHFGLTFNGKRVHTHSIQDVGGVQYFSNIKVSGKNPLQNAHVALVEVLKVVFDTTKLNTEDKIKAVITAVDTMANGLIETKEAAKKLLKKPASKTVLLPKEFVIS